MAEISDEIKECITEIQVTIDRVDVDLTIKYETIRRFVASIDQAQQQMVVNNIVNFYIDRLLRSDLDFDRWKPILQKVILYTYVFITFFMSFLTYSQDVELAKNSVKNSFRTCRTKSF